MQPRVWVGWNAPSCCWLRCNVDDALKNFGVTSRHAHEAERRGQLKSRLVELSRARPCGELHAQNVAAGGLHLC
jgi:hypothetical protein